MVQIKVTPEMLEEVAKRAYSTRHALELTHKKLCDQIDHLCYQWAGASSQHFVQMFNDAKPKAFTFINGIANVEEELKQIAEKFRTADASYDGNLVDGKVSDDNIEEGATCGPLSNASDAVKQENPEEKSIFEKIVDGGWSGAGEAVGDTIDGFKSLGDAETWENLGNSLLHPIDTLKGMGQAISESWDKDVVNGDAESRTKFFTYGLTQLALGVLGDKGVSKVVKVAKGVKMSQGMTELPQLFNKRDNFAIAGGSGLRFGLDTPDFKQTEEKLSTHQFANSGGNTNAIKPGDTSPLAPGGGLIAHEAKPGQRRGGHLIKKHVEKTDAELLQRLQSDPRIPASSSFTNRAIAERVANEVLSNPQNIAKINRWLNNPNSRPTLPLRYNGNSILGRYVERGSNGALDVENAVIVLKKDNQGSFIITGYPEK